MKEHTRPLTPDQMDVIKYGTPEGAAYSFRVIGVTGFERHFGQGDEEFGFDFLCRNLHGKPVLVNEYYHLDWNAEPERTDLCSVTVEELSPEEFEQFRATCKALPAEELVFLPITLGLRENPHLTWIG